MSAPDPASSVGKWAKAVKVSIFLKKKDGMTDDQFSHYYAHVHAALAGPMLLRHKCISYTQHHCMNQAASEPIASIFGNQALSPSNALQITPYDACSSFAFAKLQDAQSFFNDPKSIAVLGADSLNFTNPATVQVAIGDELVVIHNRELLHEGADGAAAV